MLVKRGSIWHTRLMFNGTLYQRSLKTRNKADAVQFEAIFRSSLVRGEFSIDDARRAPTLVQFEERLLPHLRANTAPLTYEFYKHNLSALKKFVPLATARLGSIDTALIEKFIQFRLKQGVTPCTVNHALRTLRRVLYLARDWKVIRDAPKVKMLPGENMREYVLSEGELRNMTAYIAEAYPTSLMPHILPFLVDTGLRISEACALHRDNVTFDDDGSPVAIRVIKGKSKYAKREIPLTKRAASALIQCLEKSKAGWCFPSKGGKKPMTRHWPSECFRTIRDALNIGPECVLHSTRHTFCTQLGAAGATAFTIQRLAGHSSIVISQRYVHSDREQNESAIKLLDVLNVPKKKPAPDGRTREI